MVPVVAEGPEAKALGGSLVGLEEARGQVLVDAPEVEVDEIGQARVVVGLGGLLGLGDDVERPIALVQGRHAHAVGKDDIALEPLDGGAALGPRDHEAVGYHDQDDVDEVGVVTHLGEVLVEPEATIARCERRRSPQSPGASVAAMLAVST